MTATSEAEVFPEDTTVTSLMALSKTAAADVIYVSVGESITNTSGEGTEESPYRSLAYAVSIAEDGAAVSMENSWISGDISLSPEDNNEKAAIYLLGDSRLELNEDSGISNMKNTNVIYMKQK